MMEMHQDVDEGFSGHLDDRVEEMVVVEQDKGTEEISVECEDVHEQTLNKSLQSELKNEGETEITISNIKSMDNLTQIARTNTKTAIKCEIKGAIVSRSIDLKLKEVGAKREEQEAQIRDLLDQNSEIERHLQLETDSLLPLYRELDNTASILGFLDDQAESNLARYRQLDSQKKERDESMEQMLNAFRKYKVYKHKVFEEPNKNVEELTARRAKLHSERLAETSRLKQEIDEANSSLEAIPREIVEINQHIEQIQHECDQNKLIEVQKEETELDEKLEDLQSQLALDRSETKAKLAQKENVESERQKLKDTKDCLADNKDREESNRKQLDESQIRYYAVAEKDGAVKKSLEEHIVKFEEARQRVEKVRLDLEVNLDDLDTKRKKLEEEFQSIQSDILGDYQYKIELQKETTERGRELEEVTLPVNKLGLQKRQLEQELEEKSHLLVKYDEQHQDYQARHDAVNEEIMKQYTCTIHEEELQKLQERKFSLITKIGEVQTRSSAALGKARQELDEVEKHADAQRVGALEKSQQNLREAKLHVTMEENELSALKDELNCQHEKLKAARKRRDFMKKREKSLQDKEKIGDRARKTETTSMEQIGILKATGKKTPVKNVRFERELNWDAMSDSSIDDAFHEILVSQPKQQQDQQHRSETFFDELLKHSPPVRDTFISRARPKFD